jgi:elongation factor P
MGEAMQFLLDGQEGLVGLVADEKLISIQLPTTVELTIVETPPSMKSASASARTKPATLETGLIVQVPEYVEPDEKIIVNTETKKFVSKA